MNELQAIAIRNRQRDMKTDESIPLDLDLRVLPTLSGEQLERLAVIFDDLAVLTRAVKEMNDLDQAAERGEAVQAYEHAAADKKFYHTVARLPAWVKL